MSAHRLPITASCLILCLGLIDQVATSPCFAQQPPAEATETKASPDDELLEKFATQMTGAVFVGRYTDGGEESKQERYEVKSAKRMNGDLWLFNARIVYGETDMTVPIPIAVKWAGKTPVITLDKVTIPGMGTFSAHVIVDGDRYAGTWQHDDHGGHLFGKIEAKSDDS